MVQNLEGIEAQKIEISVDLFAAAKNQLQFLEVVDQNRWLYDGPILERAIYRYNAYWLPLLAKYSESSSICEGPLVPPFDCEWVWHCHRLNPVRYMSDCEEFYGRVLDNSGVVSSANGSCKLQTENLWKRLYPMEPYDLDLNKEEPDDISAIERCTTYDLVSAVQRQSSFYNEVSRAHVDSDIIIQEAVGRYKAFLYLIKRSREKLINLISVPTYDIDLIWHAHQLNPSSYYKDMEKILGEILQHDDTISDTSESKKLDTAFSGTTTQWEETFGQGYWIANAEMATVVLAAEKSGAGSRCLAEAAEKHDVGARCCVDVATEKNNARCLAVVHEKKSSRCLAVVPEKKNARCLAVVPEKKSSRCLAVVPKKNNARCLAVVPKKNNARCLAVVPEKSSSRCMAVVPKKNNASCLAVVPEKNNSRCMAVVPKKNNALCLAVVHEKKNAGCLAMVHEKNSSSSRCLAMVHEKNSSRCLAVVNEKKNARCLAMVHEKNSSRCLAVVHEKNGGCGNMMKNNANEELADALNGPVAA
ncbi:unnamed protein product [Microthlaspi erraticum]|uniref:Glycine-rich domain-containing protein-like n=1 Tax=Microthlaspi erraticum TaxID=1685480 RepID=A0A6D2KIT4_9BRAS|nr:unnamed protein product [Microthlaspi erraticum]